MEFVTLTPEEKTLLLSALRYTIDKKGYVCWQGKRIKCHYSGKPVKAESCSIMPDIVKKYGKDGQPAIVCNSDELTMVEYLAEQHEAESCPKISFDESAVGWALEAFGFSMDNEGFVVKDGKRVRALDADEIKGTDLAGFVKLYDGSLGLLREGK